MGPFVPENSRRYLELGLGSPGHSLIFVTICSLFANYLSLFAHYLLTIFQLFAHYLVTIPDPNAENNFPSLGT